MRVNLDNLQKFTANDWKLFRLKSPWFINFLVIYMCLMFFYWRNLYEKEPDKVDKDEVKGTDIRKESETDPLPHPKKPQLRALPQDPEIQCYFNQNLVVGFRDPYRNIWRSGDNFETHIIQAIAKAQSTIVLTSMEFRLTNIANALVEAKNRGVTVRVIIDKKYYNTIGDLRDKELNDKDKGSINQLLQLPGDAIAILVKNDIPINVDEGKSGLMHHKFVVVDRRITIVCSGNFTTSDFFGDMPIKVSEPKPKEEPPPSAPGPPPEDEAIIDTNIATRGNVNNMVVIPNNVEIARVFEYEFNQMWQGDYKRDKSERPAITIPVGGGTVTIHFSPTKKPGKRDNSYPRSTNGVIVSQVQKAKKYVHAALFAYSDQGISDALNLAHNKGVGVKIVVENQFFQTKYSKAYDALGVCPIVKPKKKRKSKKKKRKEEDNQDDINASDNQGDVAQDDEKEETFIAFLLDIEDADVTDQSDSSDDSGEAEKKPRKRRKKKKKKSKDKPKVAKKLVHPWNKPIEEVGYPALRQGDLLHSKTGIIDGRIAIAGSHNWSSAANHSNDETLIVIDNPIVGAHYAREFNRIYQTAMIGKSALKKSQKC